MVSLKLVLVLVIVKPYKPTLIFLLLHIHLLILPAVLVSVRTSARVPSPTVLSSLAVPVTWVTRVQRSRCCTQGVLRRSEQLALTREAEKSNCRVRRTPGEASRHTRCKSSGACRALSNHREVGCWSWLSELPNSTARSRDDDSHTVA